jgi:protein-disulfide isomerase
MSPNETRPTRNQQREAAREKARALREANARKERTRSVGLKVGIVVAILAAAGIITASVLVAVNPGQTTKVSATPKNLDFDNGIKIGTNLQAFTSTNTPAPTPVAGKPVPNIVIYLDYQCPICQAFELGNGAQIREWAKSGVATLEYHPISFLDGRASPNTYSSRAENAAICVATYSPDKFFDFTQLLFQHQPAENTPGPENAELIQRTKDVGVSNGGTIASCINNKSFGNWVSDTTNNVLSTDYTVKGTNIPVKGTPVIVVNGQQYNATIAQLADPARFAAWFKQVTK